MGTADQFLQSYRVRNDRVGDDVTTNWLPSLLWINESVLRRFGQPVGKLVEDAIDPALLKQFI